MHKITIYKSPHQTLFQFFAIFVVLDSDTAHGESTPSLPRIQECPSLHTSQRTHASSLNTNNFQITHASVSFTSFTTFHSNALSILHQPPALGARALLTSNQIKERKEDRKKDDIVAIPYGKIIMLIG